MPDFSAQLYDIVGQAAFHLRQAVLTFLQRDSFLYWPFLVSTVVIGMLAWRFGFAGSAGNRSSWREFFGRHFSGALWWHPSARADYRFYLINAVLFPLLVGPFLFGENAVTGMIEDVLAPVLDEWDPSLDPAGIGVRIAYTLLFFVAFDFGRFVGHSLMHDVRFLWEFHKVHHSAEVLTPMTSFRVHPVELAVTTWVPGVTTGVVTWVFHRYVDAGIGFYTFLGLHVLLWAGNLIGNLRHSHVWLSYGQTLNRWLISPAHHQLHHSAEPRHRGCNRGLELAIWDRLYGTLYVPTNEPESFKMGLGDGTDGQWNTLARMYLWPFQLAFSLPRAQPSDAVWRDMVSRDTPTTPSPAVPRFLGKEGSN
jgi:sterol desaturase/sphingolipid hydroxylase (fatty acid hydroxylase superfamily)